jgi:AraC-like DNA-binding protein
MKQYLIFLTTLFYFTTAIANTNNKPTDSLENKNYSYFKEKINEYKKDSTSAKIYANAWLNKAKKEKNYSESAQAYRDLMYIVNKKHLLHYSDSLLLESLKSKDNRLIGNAYLTKGIIYYDQKKLKEALDNYLQANSFLQLTEDDYAIHKVKYSIAHTKYYLGFYDEAIALFLECKKYFKEENDRAYLNTLHSLGLCYNKIKDYNKSSGMNQLGLNLSKELENEEMVVYFNLSEGVNLFFKKNYLLAISRVNSCLPELENKNDAANINVANFYMAKSYWALNEFDLAFNYLIKVDKAHDEQLYIRPDLRENFELLIQYYKKKKDKEGQLLYINKLLKADSLMNVNFKYLSKKIFKEFDTNELIAEKTKIEKEKKAQQNIFTGIIAVSVSFSILLIYYHIQNQKKLKKRFEEIMSKDNFNAKIIKPTNKKPEELNINPEVVQTILQKLEKFENSKKILTKDLNINKLATILNTNPRYAARIIQHYRNKKSIDYVSNLKIEYIINLLKSESKYRNYTNKALAEEVGFSSTHNFTKAFKKITDLSPTYFIENLKKLKEEK